MYGDTDSLFIYLHGRTKEQAFLIGNEMADAITAQNPAPIKMKFEKVCNIRHPLKHMLNLIVGLFALHADGQKALCRVQV